MDLWKKPMRRFIKIFGQSDVIKGVQLRFCQAAKVTRPWGNFGHFTILLNIYCLTLGNVIISLFQVWRDSYVTFKTFFGHIYSSRKFFNQLQGGQSYPIWTKVTPFKHENKEIVGQGEQIILKMAKYVQLNHI